MTDTPEIPKELLTYLESVYPQEVPSRELSPWEYGKKAGEQAVVQMLRSHYREQQEKAPIPNVLKQT